ncbi:myb/SANT-like DNA-binding domain-containing protein 3 [Lucilia sericata]|uniref:myb/SANT-like DNA-binding domain-containing protein 3 n=1 Tax=Lucilia sericata TaxID=13632 RepID=UPI0018A853CF|nr:myb/SANT-like DNA-binding domain-containing protein 3 [Lucilia sericata]
MHKYVLENKKLDAVTWRQKKETWEKLASEFANQSGVQRTWKALRDKYENLKRKSKVEIATEKRETYRTGGGPTATSIVSNISEKISFLFGESATGLCNPYDNDGKGLNTELESKTEDVNDSIQELQSKTDDINDFIEEVK